MRSSIFNFNSASERDRDQCRASVIFVFSFIVCALLGEDLCLHLSPTDAWRGKIPEPGGGNRCVATETYSDRSDIYETLYYGFGDAVKNARRADVLLLGNSRVLFAFRDESVRRFTESTGIRVFNLCFPAGDGMPMALETMTRQNLSPAIVVVNKDGFFSADISLYGKNAVSEGAWRAFNDVMEDRVSWLVRSRLHRWLPRFSVGAHYSPLPYVFYQRIENGCLLLENFPPVRLPFHPNGDDDKMDLSQKELALAQKFENEMKKRGIALVLTDVPFGVDSISEARKRTQGLYHRFAVPDDLKPFHRAVRFSKLLKVPLVAPIMKEVETYDGNHLTRESAHLFADKFFEEFAKLPRVKALSRALSPVAGR